MKRAQFQLLKSDFLTGESRITGKDVLEMSIAISVVGIFIGFGVLIFAAYKKISMFLAAVIAAAIVALFAGLDVAASLVGSEGPFLIGMKDFVGNWLIIFAMGALLGALYDKSGARY